jgi:hypothetical protein
MIVMLILAATAVGALLAGLYLSSLMAAGPAAAGETNVLEPSERQPQLHQ